MGTYSLKRSLQNCRGAGLDRSREPKERAVVNAHQQLMADADVDKREPGMPVDGEKQQPDPSSSRSHIRRQVATAFSSTEFQLLVGVATLTAIFVALYPGTFATSQNFKNMAVVAGILLVVAVGQTIVLLVGGFDLSVSANMGFVSVVTALSMTGGRGIVSSILIGLVSGAIVGLANGIMIAVLGITPFVATLGTLTFLGGYTNYLSDGQSVPGLPEGFRYFGGGDWGPLPSALCMALVVLGVAWFLLSRTRLGLYVYAIGGSRETARTAGVVVARYQLVAYVLCGLFAGLAGLMLASRVTVGQDSLGQGYDLLSIATAVIGGVAIGGGVGRLSGVVLGVAMLVVLTTGLDIAGLGAFVKQMVTGVILIVAVLVAKMRGFELSTLFRLRRGTAAATGLTR
jgi:ribose/xylose/arabinose/galactoside ABC-type transport system permease subunit